MIGADRIRAAWQRLDAERAAVVERRMRAPVTSAAGVARQLGRDGAAWLDDLGSRRGGITADDVEELAQAIARTAVPNMAALAQAGAITGVDAILGGVGAGAGTALLIGYDLAVEDLSTRLQRATYKLVEAGLLDDRQRAELLTDALHGRRAP